MRKLTGKMLHEAYAQADMEIIGARYATANIPRPPVKHFDDLHRATQRAYNRMAEILNKQQDAPTMDELAEEAMHAFCQAITGSEVAR